jgi:hypothetical protein
MNKILLSLSTCLFLLQGAFAGMAGPRSSPVVLATSPGYLPNGYHIQLTLKPYKEGKVYLGYYYGKIRALADSAMLDGNGVATFSGKEKLPGGVYFIVSPRKAILFELLIDTQQNFLVAADTANLPGSVAFTGSPDNAVFQSYTNFTNTKGSEIVASQKELTKAHGKADSARLLEKIKKANAEIQTYREGLAVKYPNSLLTTLFHTLKEPIVPPAPPQSDGKKDSLFAYHYFKAHYWDSISYCNPGSANRYSSF